MYVRDHGAGGVWYIVARHYPSALMAKRAWERVNRKLVLGQREQGIGVQRLGPVPPGEDPGSLPSGAPEGVHPVVAASLNPNLARRADRLLHDGTEWQPTPDFADAVLLRHARIGMTHGAGKNVIRRPEGRGGRLTPDGVLHEHEAGRG